MSRALRWEATKMIYEALFWGLTWKVAEGGCGTGDSGRWGTDMSTYEPAYLASQSSVLFASNWMPPSLHLPSL